MFGDFYVLKIGKKYLGYKYNDNLGYYEPVLKANISEAERFSSKAEVESQIDELRYEKKYLRLKKTILEFSINLVSSEPVVEK